MNKENRIPTQEENPKGLHQRYRINKIRPDGSTAAPSRRAQYFVLRLDNYGSDPNHIRACRIAIHSYANAIEAFIPELAKDLRERYPVKLKPIDESVLQKAIELLLAHADEDFVSKRDALEAGTNLHNLMIGLRKEPVQETIIEDTLAEVSDTLCGAKKYGMEVEVVTQALMDMKANPSLSIEQAMVNGFNEWVK